MIQEVSNPIACDCHPQDVKISFLERYRGFILSTNTLATVGNGVLLMAGLIADWILRSPVPAAGLYIAATLVGGGPIFLLAARGIMKRDLTAGVMVSVAMIAALLIGEYSAAAIVAFMMMFGEMLENFTMARANDALKNLARLIPNFVTLLRDGQPTAISIEQVRVGDTLLVRNGERVPVDGVIVRGQAALNESAITGEAVPVDKKSGDPVFAGTLNTAGTLEIQAQKLGRDTTLGTIVKLVEEAQKSQAPVQRLANKYAQYLVPITFSIAVLVYLLTGEIVRAVTVLVVVCPCALVLATPTALVAAIGNAARKNAIVKNGGSIESLGQVDCVAFDKTGTLTLGKPRVTEVVALDSITPDQILAFAATAENCSEHPLGRAIVEHATERRLAFAIPEQTDALTGFGVRAASNGHEILIGNREWLATSGIASANHTARITELEARGHTVIPVVVNREMVGLLALSDQVRPEAQAALRALKAVGVKKTVLISGDNVTAVKNVATQLGVDEFHAQVLPDQKLEIIKKLQQQGLRVAYVGDGVNDAPALAIADVGVAMGVAGTDVAIETAGIALMNDDMRNLPYLIELARESLRTIRGSVAFSLSMNVLSVILSFLGIIGPVLGAMMHEFSALPVLAYSARLVAFKSRDAR
ncbi:MAG: cation-translocating P-type ATPase [Chloroflexi bacterium]|nr:cation-translocating P-type ATPase [Chloroflexota bacterium]